jgi:threonine aldolase
VVTNILIFDVTETGRTAADICAVLAKQNILAGPMGKYAIRMVTHYDVDRAGIDRALAAMAEILTERATTARS